MKSLPRQAKGQTPVPTRFSREIKSPARSGAFFESNGQREFTSQTGSHCCFANLLLGLRSGGNEVQLLGVPLLDDIDRVSSFHIATK